MVVGEGGLGWRKGSWGTTRHQAAKNIKKTAFRGRGGRGCLEVRANIQSSKNGRWVYGIMGGEQREVGLEGRFGNKFSLQQ